MRSSRRSSSESSSVRVGIPMRTSRRAQATAPFRMYGRLTLVLIACLHSGCGPKPLPPLTPPPVVAAHDRHVRDLQRDLAGILDTAALRHGVLAVSEKSLTRGDV